jgi:hypothetical protein
MGALSMGMVIYAYGMHAHAWDMIACVYGVEFIYDIDSYV